MKPRTKVESSSLHGEIPPNPDEMLRNIDEKLFAELKETASLSSDYSHVCSTVPLLFTGLTVIFVLLYFFYILL